MFRFLNKKEEANFRLWARTNYTPFTEIGVVIAMEQKPTIFA